MASTDVDPFGATDDAPIAVRPGEFSSEGVDQARLGASNARLAQGRGGVLGFWRGASQAHRVQVASALALLLLVALLLPALIASIGTTQRAALASTEEHFEPRYVVVSADVVAAMDAGRPLLGCFGMSAAFAPADKRDAMKAKLDAIDASAAKNDPAETTQLIEEARAHFVNDYAKPVLDNVEPLMQTWSASEWDTDEKVAAAKEKAASHLSLEQFDALCADIIELSTHLSAAKSEHMQNTSAYIPEPEPVAPETQQAPPETAKPPATQEQKPSEEPKVTDAPKPPPEDPKPSDEEKPSNEPKPSPGDNNGGGNNGGGNNGNGNG